MGARELIGLFALAVLWVNTLLVVAAAAQSLRSLARRRAAMRPLLAGEEGVGLVEGEVIRGEPLARRMIDQVGRQAADSDGRHAILFHDRGYRGEVVGGALRVGEAELEVAPATGEGRGNVEVWVDAAAVATAATGEPAQFDAAYAEASKARGHSRVVVAELRPGTKVWAVGEVARGTLQPQLLSTLDPRRWCAAKERLLALFIVAVLGAASVCTTLVLWPPHFGLVSKLGAGLGLTYFLGVQPIATLVRDLVRLPSVAILRGHWLK